MGLINKNRLCAHNSTEFCVSLTTACHVLLLQTCQTMVKQLQHSLAPTPAVRYRSLTMHRAQLVGWCYIGYLYSDWHVQCSALFWR